MLPVFVNVHPPDFLLMTFRLHFVHALHFSGRRLCKCHDQQTVHIYRMLLICQHLYNTLYQNCRFSDPAAADTRIFRLRRSMTFCCSSVHFTPFNFPPVQQYESFPTHPLWNISQVCDIHSLRFLYQIRRLHDRHNNHIRLPAHFIWFCLHRTICYFAFSFASNFFV